MLWRRRFGNLWWKIGFHGGKLDFMVKGWKAVPSLSLREAARYLNGALGSTCNCLQGCKGKKCVCFKKNMLCSSKCHAGTKCSNIREIQRKVLISRGKLSCPNHLTKKRIKGSLLWRARWNHQIKK